MKQEIVKISSRDYASQIILKSIMEDHKDILKKTVSAYIFTEQLINNAKRYILLLDKPYQKDLLKKGIINRDYSITMPTGFYYFFQIVDKAIDKLNHEN